MERLLLDAVLLVRLLPPCSSRRCFRNRQVAAPSDPGDEPAGSTVSGVFRTIGSSSPIGAADKPSRPGAWARAVGYACASEKGVGAMLRSSWIGPMIVLLASTGLAVGLHTRRPSLEAEPEEYLTIQDPDPTKPPEKIQDPEDDGPSRQFDSPGRAVSCHGRKADESSTPVVPPPSLVAAAASPRRRRYTSTLPGDLDHPGTGLDGASEVQDPEDSAAPRRFGHPQGAIADHGRAADGYQQRIVSE